MLCVSPPPWQANKDPLFLTGVTFPSEYPASPETLVKLSVYDSKDKSQESVSVQLRVLCVCRLFPCFQKKASALCSSVLGGLSPGSSEKTAAACFKCWQHRTALWS